MSITDALRSIVAAVRIESSARFALAGGPAIDAAVPAMPAGLEPELHAAPQAMAPLTVWLWVALYQHCYCRPFTGAPFTAFDPLPVPDPAFARALEEADQGRKKWDDGWTVYEHHLAADTVVVEKGDRRRAVSTAELLKTNPHLAEAGSFRHVADAASVGAAVHRGGLVALPTRREPASPQPQFYYAFGDWLGDQVDEFDTLRFYFHADCTTAPSVVRRLTAELNRLLVPFRLKCMTDPRAYDRTDAIALYVPGRYFQPAAAVAALDGAAATHPSWVAAGLSRQPDVVPQRSVPDAASVRDTKVELRPGVPLFAREISQGVGLAEDPRGPESFGMHRCRVFAQGLVDAWKSGVQNLDERCRIVEERFAAGGVDLARPWLNPGSVDWYAPISRRALVPGLAGHPPKPGASARRLMNDSPRWLDVADRIGCRLCRDAIWDGGRCNWLGWTIRMESHGPRHVFQPCSPDLYDGTAGIALFLARLSQFTNDATHRDTALAALEQARVRLDGGRPIGFGFYYGAAGVAFAEIQAGQIFDDERLVRQGVDRLEVMAASSPELRSEGRRSEVGKRKSSGSDPTSDLPAEVIRGIAGVIPLLIGVGTEHSRDPLLQAAIGYGERLLESACRDDSGWSWNTLQMPKERNLCGYGCGAAGIACALFELYALTRDPRFLAAGRGALRYERSCFDAAHGNWPDYRIFDASDGVERSGFPVSWCHGAAGVGLGRAMVYRLLQQIGAEPGELDAVRGELNVAVDTTAATLPPAEAARGGSFCLCHGLAGNAELLLLAAALLNRPELRERAEQTGDDGIRRHHSPDTPWPCGLRDCGEVPGLMRGVAGIGHFYLRLHDEPAVPTVMLAGQSAFTV